MDCRDVRELLKAGEVPDCDEEFESHLENCAVCRELIDEDGQLGDWLVRMERGAEDASEPGVELSFDDLAEEIEEEQGLGARLRESSIAVRHLTSLVVGVVVCLGVFVATPRPDIGVVPLLRFWGVVIVFGGLAAALTRGALRSPHRPPPGPWARRLLIGAGLLGPVVIASLPPAHTQMAASLAGIGDELVPRALECFLFGSLWGAPVFVAGYLAMRTGRLFLVPGLLLAAATGLIGNLALHLHCPIVHSEHLLLGHATIGFAYVLVCGLAVYLRRSAV